MPGIDLHTHSTASDGSLTPTELVGLAQRSGLQAIALTDHDTVNGLPEALAAGEEHGVEVVPGCELSVSAPKGFIHIVGLFLPEKPVKLMEGMQYLRDRRADRNERIAAKLAELGVDVTYERILEIADGGTVGRPHIARAIVEAGAASDVQNAFDVYLGEGGRAYLPKDKFTPEKALALLKAEGATTILAHPYTMQLDGDEEAEAIAGLMDMGLDGIECHYTEHTRTMTEKYLALAERMDLLVSGGSDFHGSAKPDIALGRGRGGLRVPYALLDAMREHRVQAGLPV